MIHLERTSVMNVENAIRGARNPHNSWARMDSAYDEEGNFILGEHLKLLGSWSQQLGKGSPKTKERGKDPTLRDRQVGDLGCWLTCERWIQVDSLKLIRIILGLQKRYILDMLVLLLFTALNFEVCIQQQHSEERQSEAFSLLLMP